MGVSIKPTRLPIYVHKHIIFLAVWLLKSVGNFEKNQVIIKNVCKKQLIICRVSMRNKSDKKK